MENESKSLLISSTTKDALEEAAKLQESITVLETRLEKLSGEGAKDLISKEDKKAVEKEHEASIKEWRKRKRMCLNIIDAIMESYPKSKKAFFEETGIATDEENGAKIPDSY